MKCESEVAVWFDLLLILLAISPFMRATRFLVKDSGALYSRRDEADFNSWLARPVAAPATRPHPGQEY